MSNSERGGSFYELTPEEQAARLEQVARASLPAWDLGSDAKIELIKHRENAVYRVSDGTRQYALRVHRAGYHTDAELESELQWIAAINSDEIRTPQVIRTEGGRLFTRASAATVPEERQVDLLEWFEGQTIASIEQGLAEPARQTDTFFLVGQLMASTHNHSQEWQRPPGFVRHAWDEEGILGAEPLWGRYWKLPVLTGEQRDRLAAAREQALAELAQVGKGEDRYGLIHADFLPENLLRSDAGICLIDFDDAGFGWHLFDVATTLFFQLGESHLDEVTGALIEGYRTRRELADELLAHLPLFFLLRGYTYLGWAHTRSETETAQALTPLVVAAVDGLAQQYLAGGSAQ